MRNNCNTIDYNLAHTFVLLIKAILCIFKPNAEPCSGTKLCPDSMTTETVSPTPIEFFAFQSWTMRLLGSSMKRIENTRGNRLRSLVNCLTFPWIILPLGYTTVLSYPDITAICSMMGLVTGFVMASVKLPSLHCNVESFVRVRDKILQLWTRVGCGEDTDLRRYVRFVQRFSQANAFALVVGSVTYLMAPLFITMFQYFHGESIEIWPAPFFGNYYFDIQYSPAYELVFLYAFYSICLCVVLCNAIDSVFFESCLIVACHFKILQTRLRTLDFRSDAFRENLLDLVEYQMQIYEATEAIQKAFFTILPPFFIVASMMFCAELYTSTLVRKPYGLYSCAIRLMAIVVICCR